MATILHRLKPGDHVITGHDIYGRSYRLMHDVFRHHDINFDVIDMAESGPSPTRDQRFHNPIWIETPSN